MFPRSPSIRCRTFSSFPPACIWAKPWAWPPTPKDTSSSITRSANTRLFEFDQNGNYVREIGEGNYGFEFAHSVRVDPQDNIWVVDEGTNMVIKFNPAGRVVMVLGHRPEVVAGAVATTNGPAPPAEKYTFGRPTDVAWDPQGNIFVSDGYGNQPRGEVRQERQVPQTGGQRETRDRNPASSTCRTGSPWMLQGNVYVADRANHRMQVFDNDLARKAIYDNIGDSWTVCVSPGPHQYLFTSNSNPNGNAPGSWDITGEIYKMELDGTIVGKFGHAEQSSRADSRWFT